MIEYREAIDIASRFYDAYSGCVLVSASKARGGWLFDYCTEGESAETPNPGWPFPVFVSSDTGEAVEVILPSDEGFKMLDSITEENLELWHC